MSETPYHSALMFFNNAMAHPYTTFFPEQKLKRI